MCILGAASSHVSYNQTGEVKEVNLQRERTAWSRDQERRGSLLLIRESSSWFKMQREFWGNVIPWLESFLNPSWVLGTCSWVPEDIPMFLREILHFASNNLSWLSIRYFYYRVLNWSKHIRLHAEFTKELSGNPLSQLSKSLTHDEEITYCPTVGNQERILEEDAWGRPCSVLPLTSRGKSGGTFPAPQVTGKHSLFCYFPTVRGPRTLASGSCP